ncbi:nitroreductase [Myxococcaceae bacterium JPH2]|nr:nitroreductase [Myxococcaceae bacterium JPH2]
MDALECLMTRRTAPVLTGPEPTREQLDQILRAAVTAPDHKLQRPWRFVIVRGAGRERLGEALVAAARAADPGMPAEVLERQRMKALRAPLQVVVIASPKEPSPAPRWEQLASAAAAAQNVCLAAHALGLGSGWKSTPLGEQAPLREALGMQPGEELLGLIELGYVPSDAKLRPRVAVDVGSVTSELGGERLSAYVPPSAG